MSRPFIPVVNTASVELIYSMLTETVENVFYVGKSSPYSLADLQAVRAIFDTWHQNYWSQGLSVGVALQRIRSKALDSLGSPFEDYSLATARSGAVGGSIHAGNVTFSIKKGTGLTGRSFRGRLYVTGIPNTLLTDANHVLSGTITNWLSYLNTLKSTLLSAGHTMYIVSYRSNKDWRSSGLRTAITTFVAVDNALDSMRRRLPNH